MSSLSLGTASILGSTLNFSKLFRKERRQNYQNSSLSTICIHTMTTVTKLFVLVNKVYPTHTQSGTVRLTDAFLHYVHSSGCTNLHTV